MRIAVAQIPGATLEQWQETLQLIESLVKQAADRGAALVVFPECAWPTYYLESKPAYLRCRATGMPGPDAFLAHISAAARTHRLAICCGYVHEDGERLTNAACLMDNAGLLCGIAHKTFLWDFDRRWFEPGSCIRPIDTELGRIGVMICADARYPEIPATLAARGAQLIVQPTAWVNTGTSERPENPQAAFIIPDRAREFGVPIASASKWGREGDTTFVGSSLICDAAGNRLVQAGQAETTVVVADVEPRPGTPPVVTAAERAVLMSAYAAGQLVAGPLPAVRLELVADGEAVEHAADPAGRDGLVRLLLRRDAPVAHVMICGGRAAAPVILRPDAAPRRVSGCTLAAVHAADAARFAVLRALTLQGVHIAIVYGDDIATDTLRTRAAENRIFVICAGGAAVEVFDPRGRSIARLPWPAPDTRSAPPGFDFDPNFATDKYVAWQTHTLANRTPELWEF